MKLSYLFLMIAPLWAQVNSHQFCSGIKQCLNTQLPQCSVADMQPLEDLEYNAEVCAPFREMRNRGLDFQNPIVQLMLSNLGGPYRVTYEVGGQLPVNVEMMDYLMDHMPFTAELVNAYQGTQYHISYLEGKKRFAGDNGRSLKGTFRWVTEDSAGVRKGQRNVFWGLGSAKVMLWELHGLAVVFFDFDPIDARTMKYRLRAVVFPGNGMLNGVMRMNMFRNVVLEKMQMIVTHIENSAKRFGAGERGPILKSSVLTKDPVMKEFLQGFDAQVKKSGYYSNTNQKK